jgi:hypothetical protein
MKHRRVLGALAIAGTVALVASCGSAGSRAGFDTNEGKANTGGGELLPGAISDDGGAKGEGCKAACSADLHYVLDCSGQAVKECPTDQACGAGLECVPACDGARDNKSSVGCDYYVPTPDSISVLMGACFATFVTNTWWAPVKLSVDRGGQTFDASKFAYVPTGSGKSLKYEPLPGGEVPPGGVAVVFLNRRPASMLGITLPTPPGMNYDCPAGVVPAVTDADTAVHGSDVGTAFHVVASAPVVMYDMFPFGGGQSAATSATLLLPSSAWDTNYIGVNGYRKSDIADGADPFLQIIAAEDGTNVKLSPTAAVTGAKNVAATGAGQPKTYVLNRGQYLQITQGAELSGSPIESDKPIAVFGGSACMNIDTSTEACDTAHQQLPPVRALGREYAAVRYRNRVDGKEESTYFRLVGAVDGTKLVYEPAAPSGAPSSLTLGQVAEFQSPGQFVVKSQDDAHPFYLAAHMTGGKNFDGRGDPEFVNVVPSSQFLSRYVFFTDPTYPETNLVVTRTKTAGAFKEVNLDCAGNLGGWQPLGTSGLYEYTRVDLSRGNFQKQGNCDNGRHEMTSEGTFGLTVWGWGSSASAPFLSTYVSYAYPAGASVKPVNGVIVPAAPR